MSDHNTTTTTTTTSMAMYCHACHNQWQQQADAIECPACRSASTEIVRESLLSPLSRQSLTEPQITPENDPRRFHNRQSTDSNAPVEFQPTSTSNTPSSPDHEMRDAPSTTRPENAAPAQEQDQSRPPRTPRPEFVFMVPPPAITFFTTIVSDTHVPPPNAAGPRGPPVAHFGINFFFPQMPPHGPTPAAPPSTGTTTPGQSTETATQGNAQSQEQSQEQSQPQQPQQSQPSTPHFDSGMPPMVPGFLGALLTSIFNPAAAAFGDAVYSQEALDRIISQLREQAGPGGAPPASQAAIDKLEVRELDEKMLGGESKSRCVICVDEMSVGEKASVLPCSHFFHGECVTPWLKQHNTCPVCRRSVEPEVKTGKGAEFTQEAHQHHETQAGCP
ncbi:hypothetical protein QBC34DRAFT_391543 [Podospora aff. communis PSN243]|uniref:RING-type E3 ubiquitin transferase n=1 Tax=Podospora aff. communis PSN243 TaxID=3040156 RepID=A0AAV9H539_9PEZI|nr:hypothetical protein QBC34DRAFT_391543 [Podospora aff. communis PSN243]